MADLDFAMPRRKLAVVCPLDGGGLLWEDPGVTCRECGHAWERAGNIAVFTGGRTGTESGIFPRPKPAGDDFEAGADWCFLLPFGSRSRVLVIGFAEEEVASAIAPDVEAVGAIDTSLERIRALETYAAALGLDNVVPAVATPGTIPFPNRSFDLAVLDSHLLPVRRETQLERLRAVRRKLNKSGRLFLPVENRWGRFFPGKTAGATDPPRRSPGSHGLDGWRKLLREAGFTSVEFHAAFPDARAPRELLPLDEPTAFDWWWDRRTGQSGRERVGLALAKRAFRWGLLPRVVPHLAVLAHREGSS